MKTLNKELADALKGLLKIAKIAMPDTYYATDTRIKKANKALERYKKEVLNP